MEGQLINKVVDILIISEIDEETINTVRNKLTVMLQDYEVRPAETGMIPYIESDDRLINEFLITKKVDGRSDKTLKLYRNQIKHFMQRTGKRIEEITTKDIVVFLAVKESEGVSRATCNNYKHTLSSLFEYLVSEEAVKSNPVRKMGNYKVPKKIKEAYTDREVEIMRNSLVTYKQKAVFEILISTACRVSELCGIRTDRISNGQILITGKGNKERMLILNARTQIAINNYLNSEERKSKESEYLFPGRFKGAATVQSIEKMLKQLGDANGIHAHPHKFRRTCASNALNRGMDIAYISKMLGHSNINTTQIYLSISDEDLAREHKRYIA